MLRLVRALAARAPWATRAPSPVSPASTSPLAEPAQGDATVGALALDVSGLPGTNAAEYRVLASDGHVVTTGVVRTDEPAPAVRLPAGTYRLQWMPTRARIGDAMRTFAPTVFERAVQVLGALVVDGSVTYVFVQR